jgi:hypothetical protein
LENVISSVPSTCLSSDASLEGGFPAFSSSTQSFSD